MIAWLLALSFAGSCVAWPLSRLFGRRAAGWLLSLVPAGLFVAFLGMAPTIEAGEAITQTLAWAPSLGVDLSFRLDGFSFLFALLITGIGALVVIYSGAYMSEESKRNRARFFTLILLFMTAMLGAVLSDNLLVVFLFWEATSILSFLLIGFDADSPSARRAALMSLRVTAAGGLALLAAIILIGATLGSYSLSDAVAHTGELAQSRWIVPIMIGLLLGVFTKSAQFPFHFWLPNAMQAPTPASAYLHSATMVKLGIYLLARFEPLVGAVPLGRDVVVTVAIVTMLVGAVQVLRAEHFKAVLAYSTVASLGILVMLVGLDGPAATAAMVGYILAHALYKATLFFCAGSVLHTTGLSKLRAMGRLARFLPVTAVAAAFASLSMAGLPPFVGFISKEFLFLAQIQSSWDAVPLAAAVLVNAVIVGAAGVVTLRPFFMGRGTVKEVRHGETPGLLLAPVVLALLGLLVSLEPGWVSRAVLRPAAAVVYGAPVEIDLALWHGLTPMLALSAVVIAIGAVIFIFWRPIHVRLRLRRSIDRFDTEDGYELLIRRVEALAAGTARRVQHGDLRVYVQVVLAGAAAFVLWGMIAVGRAPRPPSIAGIGGLRIGPTAVALIGLAAGVAATRARSLLSTMIAVGLVGLVTALIFMMNGAPDLALTQFAVESLIVVLLAIVLLVLPSAAPSTRTARQRTLDAALSIAFAAIMFVALLDMGMAPRHDEVSAFYGAQSYLAAFGRNVVNVILVDFRGFDTLGETTVIALAAVFAWSLLGPRTALESAATTAEATRAHGAFILRITSPIFFWLLAVLSVAILLRGHNEIGGGFVGGLVAALAFALLALASGVARARAVLRFHPLSLVGTGLLLAIASGIPGLVLHGDFLRHAWIDVTLFGIHIHQGTALIFDLGVYTVVLGGVLAFLFGLRREAAR
ncbi:MAG TPA: hydrogen gas-evolving membrane-bound hydrogenase subunit E [Gemmatimonadaceae bacterium]|nr:hydrogen gas-evolving membrane-bound hydrogenase subunit E [Gemmatimonadaceae bacterium]